MAASCQSPNPRWDPAATHQTSPRRGIVPGFCDIAGSGVEFPLDQENILILICQVTRTRQLLVLRLQSCHERLYNVTGPGPAGGHSLSNATAKVTGRENAIFLAAIMP